MSLINISPSDLEAFVCVADHGSFRAAGEALGLSQPAVSARIQHLESVLCVRLFDRTTRRVRITSAGERLRQRVNTMIVELRDLAQEFRDETQLRRGRLTLGASPSVAASFLPEAIGTFRQRWPMIELTLHDDFFGRVLDRLTNGEVDLAVLPFAPDQRGLVFERLMTDEHLIVMPEAHRLARESSLTIRQIAETPMISLPPHSVAWTTLRRAYESAGFEFRPTVQTRNSLTAIAMVRAGEGLAFMTPLLMQAINMKGLVTRRVTDANLSREIGMITNADRAPTPATLAMQALLRRLCQ